MLQSIRDRTQGWIAGVIISLLIFSFALWGISSYLGGNGANNVVAKVDGQEITKGELTVTYERMKRQLQARMNLIQLPLQAETTLKDNALQSLIENRALKQASLNKGYRISNSQIDAFLVSLPEFQDKGKFSTIKFKQLLDANLYSPASFIEIIHSSLLIDQPKLGIIFSDYALPGEVAIINGLINQEREIAFALLPTALIEQIPVKVSEAAINEYYEAHQDEFKTLEQVSIEYIRLTLNDVLKNIHPTQEALHKFYQENSASFAKQAPVSKDKKLPAQLVSVPAFDEVKDKVQQAYAKQQAEEKFIELREKLASMTYEHPESLEPAAKQLDLKIESSATFSKDQGKDIATDPKVRSAAFSDDVLTRNNNSDVIQLNNETAVVVRVKTHSPAKLLSQETVKTQIIQKLEANQRDAKAKQLAEEIQQKLTQGMSLEKLTAEYHLTWNKLNFINRQTDKVDTAILNSAFSMPKPAPHKMSFTIAHTKSGYAIVMLSNIRESNLKSVTDEEVQNAHGMIEYELYKNSLIKQADIKIEN